MRDLSAKSQKKVGEWLEKRGMGDPVFGMYLGISIALEFSPLDIADELLKAAGQPCEIEGAKTKAWFKKYYQFREIWDKLLDLRMMMGRTILETMKKEHGDGLSK